MRHLLLIALAGCEAPPEVCAAREASPRALSRAEALAADLGNALPRLTWLANETRAARQSTWLGDVLDAGTGPASLSWLLTLPVESIMAVSAELRMMQALAKKYGRQQHVDHVTLVRHNWVARVELPASLSGKRYDTVVVDYLLAAVGYTAPFGEHSALGNVVERLAAPDGMLLLTGREPYPYPGRGGADAAALYERLPCGVRLVLETERVRDAAMLASRKWQKLSHQPPYRELPCEWVEDFLVGRGLQVEAVRSFDTFHTYEDLRAQWSVAWHEAGKVDELTKAANLSAALIAQLARLEEEAGQCTALREPGFAFGGEYAIVARPRREGRSAGGPSKCPAAIAALRHPPLSVDEFHRRMTAPTVGL